MRYQNWDVLLFPEGSRTPIQEFKTTCHAAKDLGQLFLRSAYGRAHAKRLDSPFLNKSFCAGVPFAVEDRLHTHLPVLTSFVPSLNQNAPFRVSVHSWERPKASRTIESLVGPRDTVLFEVRVYADGVLMA